MRLTVLAAAAAGYVLGTKAGRQRYEQIMRGSRRLAGSQTVQQTAGVLRAQADGLVRGMRDVANQQRANRP